MSPRQRRSATDIGSVLYEPRWLAHSLALLLALTVVGCSPTSSPQNSHSTTSTRTSERGPRGYVGLSCDSLARHLGGAENKAGGEVQTVVVVGVIRGAPAQQAGIVAGDLIESINGQPVDGIGQYREQSRDWRAGETLTLAIKRDEKIHSFSLEPIGFKQMARMKLKRD